MKQLLVHSSHRYPGSPCLRINEIGLNPVALTEEYFGTIEFSTLYEIRTFRYSLSFKEYEIGLCY